MISSITINNYALIDRTEINMAGGFSVITGETGAGKSILLGAIGLTLGQRADSSVIMDKSRKCVIEVTYQVKGYALENWFAENELDYDEQVIVRREIAVDGKSRAFINDTPVNNKMLKELGDFLVDIHSQHQSLLIGQPEYQLNVLDSYCGNQELLAAYQIRYRERQRSIAELARLKERVLAAEKEEDYLKFQFNQLDAANLRMGEQRELEEEQRVLANAENIKTTFLELSFLLTGSDTPLVQQLKGVKNHISALRNVVKEAAGYEERLQSIILELEDMADESERLGERIEYTPDRVESVEGRLNVIYDLLHKHRVEGVEDLIRIKEDIGIRLKGIVSFSEQIDILQKKIEDLEKEMEKLAGRIHKSRVEGEGKMKEEMRALLVGLGIKHAVFSISINPLDHFVASGKDDVQFKFAANKNQEPGELSRVASGGEISRLMLSLKYILCRNRQLPVIIFDEIDTGVSGEIAHRMASMMREMSCRMQVISISHLPQIAAAGTNHFKVYKEDGQANTVSRIKWLDEEERIREIAGMISGHEISKAALENARLLVRSY